MKFSIQNQYTCCCIHYSSVWMILLESKHDPRKYIKKIEQFLIKTKNKLVPLVSNCFNSSVTLVSVRVTNWKLFQGVDFVIEEMKNLTKISFNLFFHLVSILGHFWDYNNNYQQKVPFCRIHSFKKIIHLKNLLII